MLSIGLFRSLAASPNTVAHNVDSSQTTPTPIHLAPNDTVSPGQKPDRPDPPHWSLLYDPEVERALDLQLTHTFKYDSPPHCVKMSPDGQSLAVGLGGDGKTCIYELETGTNIWLVTQPLDFRFRLT